MQWELKLERSTKPVLRVTPNPPKVGTFLACNRAAVNTPTGSQKHVIQSLRYLISRSNEWPTHKSIAILRIFMEAKAANSQVLKRTKGL